MPDPLRARGPLPHAQPLSRDPYRRPAPAPPPEKPRGVVVRRADGPADADQAEKRRTQARFRAQSIRIQAELENGQRRGAMAARAVGGLAFVSGLLLSAATMGQLSAGHYSARSTAMAPALMFVGVWYLSVGAGGATSIADAPPWVKISVVDVSEKKLFWGMSGYVDFLAVLAR